MDLEDQLRRVLLEHPTPEPAEDVVASVHAGMRRRVRRQRLSYAGAAAGVLALWGGALAVLYQGPTTTKPQVPVYTVANVPAGFQIRDLTFVSTTRGYGLGTVPCTRGRCTVLLQTDTGTQQWESAISPSEQVSQLRFAQDSAGEEIGYAYGPSYLVFRGGEWQREQTGLPVEALEAARAGTVVRVLARRGGGHVVQQSTVGSRSWRTVLDITAPTRSAVLRRQGTRLVLVTYDNNQGVRAEDDVSDVRFSTDGGTTWVKGAHNPCDPQSSFRSITLGRGHDVLALCTHRAGGSFLRLSGDDGLTFGSPVALPRELDATQVSAPAGGGWLVAGAVADERVRTVVSSEDAGATWRRVATEPVPKGAQATGYLDNSNARTVWWIGADPRYVWRTDDGGEHWTVARFA